MDRLTKSGATVRYGMVIDAGRCIGCYNCFLGCRDEHAGNDHLPVALAQPDTGQKWIEVRERERGSFPKVKVNHVPIPCLQCADAGCMAVATGGAVYRRNDGIVIIDPEKARGQRQIVSACPYRVVSWNEAKNVPQKCTFCAHLLDQGWKEPRCVEACPTGALAFGDLNDPQSGVAKRRAGEPVEELHPEYRAQPLVAYLGLPKRFVAGEIVFGDDAERPADGVRVTLRHGEHALSTATDSYGDFEFEGLEANAEYVLRVEHAGYRPSELRVRTNTDRNVGEIALEPAT